MLDILSRLGDDELRMFLPCGFLSGNEPTATVLTGQLIIMVNWFQLHGIATKLVFFCIFKYLQSIFLPYQYHSVSRFFYVFLNKTPLKAKPSVVVQVLTWINSLHRSSLNHQLQTNKWALLSFVVILVHALTSFLHYVCRVLVQHHLTFENSGY